MNIVVEFLCSLYELQIFSKSVSCLCYMSFGIQNFLIISYLFYFSSWSVLCRSHLTNQYFMVKTQSSKF